MFLMRSVDCYTFLTVSVITTGFQARTVIFVFILLTKFRCKFFLQSQPLDTVSLMKFYHCIQFFLVPFNLHVIMAPPFQRFLIF